VDEKFDRKFRVCFPLAAHALMFIRCASCRHSVTRHLGGCDAYRKRALIALVLVASLGCGWLGFQLSGWFLGAHLGWPSWLVVAARIAVGVAAAIVGPVP
jgi:hypothetical protein